MVSSLPVREEVTLAPLTTFGVGGAARYFLAIKSEQELADGLQWAAERSVPVFVLGGGSNLLVQDGGFDGLVLRMEITGIESCGDGCFDVGAGESWDGFVSSAVAGGFAGIECMAGVPGSVGGTPVQNVGAYGQEVSETIVSVRAYDRSAGKTVELTKADCRFRYRESRFNTDEPGRFVVTRVQFQLVPDGSACLKYAELQQRFSGEAPTLVEVSSAVRDIRRGKGMLLVEGDPDCRSAGSFFKNPVVPDAKAAEIAASEGVEVPHWPAGEGRVKLPAAWLLERAGFVKGFGEGRVGISSRHTLALVNRGGATFADVSQMQDEIVTRVWDKFGVRLVREPVVVGGAKSNE
jgi:UDP-N-acetylmuramate dehydrogenase